MQENELHFKAGIFEIEDNLHCMDSVCNISYVCKENSGKTSNVQIAVTLFDADITLWISGVTI